MTAALALPSLLPGRIERQGLAIPADLTYAEWESALRTAEFLEEASPWVVVDLMAYGEERFGEGASQAFPDAIEDPTGKRQAKLKQAAWMATKYPRGTRVPGVSYTHHRIVAERHPAERRELLETARDAKDADGTPKPWSSRRLIEEVQRRDTAVQGHAVSVDGAPLPGDDLDWVPSKHDLTDEFRLMFEHRLAGIGKRHAIGFEAGWMAALVCADYLAAFKRDDES